MSNDREFLRSFAERAWDAMQLAEIQALELCLIDYQANAWRRVEDVPPPVAIPVLAIGSPGEGVLVLVQTQGGDWRTTMGGQPHKPPIMWMPCPEIPRSPTAAATKLSVAK